MVWAMKLAPLLVFAALLLPSCGEEWQPPAKKPARKPSAPLLDSSGAPSLGSEHDPALKPHFGISTVTRDTWILPKISHYKNFARVHFGKSPTRGDHDTWEMRQKEGRVFEIAKGTKVKRRKKNRFQMNDGQIITFISVEVADGSMTDDHGYPRRGNIFVDYLSDPVK